MKCHNSRTDPFILSESPPTENKDAIIVGEIKLSAYRLYLNYVVYKETAQLNAICRYTGQHVPFRTAVFLTVRPGTKSQSQQLQAQLGSLGLSQGVLLIVLTATK
jgi:hypothetical protein